MRKLLLLISLLCLFAYTLSAQMQGIRWKTIAGTENLEDLEKVIPAKDGGYLTVGYTYFDSSYSLLLIKFTAAGAMEWKKTYGGSYHEYGITGIATSDGNFLVVGTTGSVKNDGDVKGHHGAAESVNPYNSDDAFDVWVLKIDSKGSIVWTKTFGGKRFDRVLDIIRTSDNQYLLCGQTRSNDGDLAGVRRIPVADNDTDIWIFKMDDNGNMGWQKCYGGSDYETAYSEGELSDGYVIVGSTQSSDFDVQSPRHAPASNPDIWVLKINMSGDLQWQKIYGGSGDEHGMNVLRDGTHIIVGGQTSSSDGDVVGYNPGNYQGAHDFWVFELDESGTLLSQKTFGSTRNDWMADMLFDADRNFQVIGQHIPLLFSYNPSFVKLNHSKDIMYEHYPENLRGMEPKSLHIADNGAMIVGGTIGFGYNAPGDKIYGQDDFFLLQFGDVNTITGKVFLDGNSNGIRDAGEHLMNGLNVFSTKGSNQAGSTSSNGVYSNLVDTGYYTTSVYLDNHNYTVVPASATSAFAGFFDTATVNFAVQPMANKNDLRAVLIPLSPARPGFQAQYRLKLFNEGTTVANPQVLLLKDQHQTVVSAAPANTSAAGNTVTWQLPALPPLDTATIDITMQLAAPPVLNLNDTIRLFLMVNPQAGDVSAANNADTLKQVVVGSFDPNDKTESHGGVITPAQISGADPLTYTIRFQNMGTDTAFTITVRDTLDNRLDWSSLQMIDASHSYQLAIESNKLTWVFNNIRLVDHTTNEQASHGFIVYQIKPLQTVSAGDTIKNGAGIYFDYNLPVQTNIENTTVVSFTALPVTMTSFRAVLNNGIVDVKWETAVEDNVKHFEVQRSINGEAFNTIGFVQPGKSNYQYKDTHPLKGHNYYRIKTIDLDGDAEISPIALVKLGDDKQAILSIYPNPGNGSTVTISLPNMAKGIVQVVLFDQMGRLLLTKQQRHLQEGLFKTDLPLSQLSKGIYILKVIAGGNTRTNTLVIQ